VFSSQNLGLIIRLLNALSFSLSINLSIALKLFFSLLDMTLLLLLALSHLMFIILALKESSFAIST